METDNIHVPPPFTKWPNVKGYEVWPNVNRYEVFLSFSGKDVRRGFIEFLYESLADSGIYAFIDHDGIEIGEEIMPKILQVIRHTEICIPIFSKNFASSKSCLTEVAEMVACERTIMPIFYDVSPSVVGKQEESYQKSFCTHAAEGVTSATTDDWKEALQKACGRRGWELEKYNHREHELIKKVVSAVRRLLKKDDLNVTARLVGMDCRVQEVMKLLGVHYENGEVIEGQTLMGKRMVEISGLPGIGKSTLATVVYNKIYGLFEGCSFLEVEGKSLLSLQGDLICDLQKKRYTPRSPAEGAKFIKYKFKDLRVLIVLDDVSDFKQILSLGIHLSEFGPGSRIILISTKSNLVFDYLQAFEISKESADHCADIIVQKYVLEEMNDKHAFQLFCKCALGGKPLQERFSSLAWKISSAAGGLPSVIQAVGSSLSRKPIEFWEEALFILNREPLAKSVERILKRSYEPVRLDQDMIEAGSSTDEYAGIKWGGVKVEQAKRDKDMIKLEGESTYDVFLSSGNDSLLFASSLYRRLKADSIRVFRDDGILGTSKELPPLVYSSKIYIPIFSNNYVRSPWCLDELALMVEHTSRSSGKKEILPVFYHGQWLDEKLETTSLYRDALDTQRQIWGAEKVEQWKKALVEVGKIKRWKLSSYKRGSQRALIVSIVGEILFKLMMEPNYVFEHLSTGDNPILSYKTSELKDNQESKIMELLKLDVNDVRIIGIHGRDGIGKTTLAKIVYDQISFCFDACSFLAEIEETTQQPGGFQYLQTKLIFDILKREYEVASAFEEVQFLKEIFRNMKVLIVLDDVESGSLLEKFVGAKLDWFGFGSRIIVTSKETGVLQGFVTQGVARTYNVNPMDNNLAFSFFWQYAATEKTDKLRSFVEIAIELVKAAKGLPLLLKVFGSFLHDKKIEEWIEFGGLIRQFQEDYQKILRKIYNDLDQKQKQMYLDIACFPPDVDRRIASYMWHCYDYPRNEIEVLRRMSLIEIEENKIGMHSMLRCLAREISREGSHDPAIAQGTIKETKKTGRLSTEVAGHEILPKTTFLSLGRANIDGKFADALLNVRWLHWQGCPRDEISIHLEEIENLIILDLSWSKITESWGCWKGKKMECLKVLNLTGCVDLLVIPSFSCCPNLEILILERCSRLVHLDPSINDLKLLVTLNLKFCSELSMLPVEMDGMNALKELLIDGTFVRELPPSIGKLVQLEILSATNCFSLDLVPDSVRELTSLSVLALDDAKIVELPESIGYLRKLRRLSLRDCRGLRKLPESMTDLENSLVELDISGTGITKLPDSTRNLWSLKVLKMNSSFVKEFPRNIGSLKKLQVMDIKFCTFVQELPEDIYCCEALKELYIDGTEIRAIDFPEGSYTKLEILSACNCKSFSLSNSIGNLQSLLFLALNDTELSELPCSIGSLINLEKLYLRNCRRLRKLPDSIGDLQELQVMDLSDTLIDEIPSSVKALRNLKVLKMARTLIREFPGGIKNLESLEEIDFSGCRNLRGKCNITGLSSLRVLLLEYTDISQLIVTDRQPYITQNLKLDGDVPILIIGTIKGHGIGSTDVRLDHRSRLTDIISACDDESETVAMWRSDRSKKVTGG